MIPPGYISLQALFSQLASHEAAVSSDKLQAAPVAAGRLQHSLVTGALPAFRIDAKGELHPVAVEEWRGEAEIFSRKLMLDRSYTDVVIPNEGLGALLPPARGNARSEQREKKRGRPQKDRDQLCAAVAVAAYRGGRKPTQAATIKGIQEAFDLLYGSGTAPVTSTLQDIADAIMEAFKREGIPIEK